MEHTVNECSWQQETTCSGHFALVYDLETSKKMLDRRGWPSDFHSAEWCPLDGNSMMGEQQHF